MKREREAEARRENGGGGDGGDGNGGGSGGGGGPSGGDGGGGGGPSGPSTPSGGAAQPDNTTPPAPEKPVDDDKKGKNGEGKETKPDDANSEPTKGDDSDEDDSHGPDNGGAGVAANATAPVTTAPITTQSVTPVNLEDTEMSDGDDGMTGNSGWNCIITTDTAFGGDEMDIDPVKNLEDDLANMQMSGQQQQPDQSVQAPYDPYAGYAPASQYPFTGQEQQQQSGQSNVATLQRPDQSQSSNLGLGTLPQFDISAQQPELAENQDFTPEQMAQFHEFNSQQPYVPIEGYYDESGRYHNAEGHTRGDSPPERTAPAANEGQAGSADYVMPDDAPDYAGGNHAGEAAEAEPPTTWTARLPMTSKV
jgi:hypothetical protein